MRLNLHKEKKEGSDNLDDFPPPIIADVALDLGNQSISRRSSSRRLSFTSFTDAYELPRRLSDRMSLSSLVSFTESHQIPRSLSLASFIFITSVGTALLCLLAFIVIPHSNALEDHDAGRILWWQCVAACSGCFGLFQAFTIRHTLELFVIDSSTSIGMFGTFCFWASYAIGYFLGYAGVQYMWLYPAPFGVFIGHLMGILLLLPTIFFVARSHLQKEEVFEDMIKQILWLVASMAFLTLMHSVTIVMASFVGQTTGGVQFLGAPALAMWRYFSGMALSQIYNNIDEHSKFLGYYVCWLITGIYTVMIIGGSENELFGVFVFLVNIAESISQTSFIDKVTKAQREIQTHSHALDNSVKRSLRWLVVSELGQVMIPVFYIICWFGISLSPSGAGFAGIGVNALGSFTPKNEQVFATNIAVWFGLEFASIIAIHFYIRKQMSISLLDHAAGILQRYGLYMALWGVFSMNFAFCVLMISCGVDVSFRFGW